MQRYSIPYDSESMKGQRTLVNIDGHSIAVFNVDGSVYAIDDRCPHTGSSLACGKLNGLTVQCPAHGLKFKLDTGCMIYTDALKVRTYPVHIRNGNLELELAPNPMDQKDSK